jgi:hypothetical protein
MLGEVQVNASLMELWQLCFKDNLFIQWQLLLLHLSLSLSPSFSLSLFTLSKFTISVD